MVAAHMDLFWASMNPVDRIFLICTIIGAILFMTRFMMALFTGDGGDGDVDGVETDVHDADISFKVLTVQGITAFFLVFGLTGLALSRGSHVTEIWAILGALAAGVAIMMVLAKLTAMMKTLHSSGNLNVSHAVGQKGVVYLTIPAGGTGQVQVTIDNRMMTLDAVAEDKKTIKTEERVEIIEVIDGRLLVVKKI